MAFGFGLWVEICLGVMTIFTYEKYMTILDGAE